MLIPRARISAGSGAAGGLGWLAFMLKPQPVSLGPDVVLGRVALWVDALELVLDEGLEGLLELVPEVTVGLETITFGAGGGGLGKANNRRFSDLGALALEVVAVGLSEVFVAGFALDFDALVVFDAPEAGLLESDFELDLLESGFEFDWLESCVLEAGLSASALALGMDGEGCTFGATVTITASTGRAGTRT